MTDKVQKIREEVERLKGWNNNVRNSTRHMTLQEENFNRGKHSSYLEILNFIDSLQEEPVSEVWHDASEEPKPNMELICVGKYCNPLVLSSNSDSFKSRYISKWAYFNDLLNLSNVQRTVKNWKEPVSEDLDKAAEKYAHEAYSHPVDRNVGKADFIAGAKWQKEQMMANAVEGYVTFGYYDNDNKTYGCIAHDSFCLEDRELKDTDKVKMILIKKD